MRHRLPSSRPVRSAGFLPRRGVAAWTGWLARWMLVLLLLTDQVGAPLHHHRHDSGVDGSWSTASAEHDHDHDHDGFSATPVDHDRHFAHATLALCPTNECIGVDAPDESSHWVALPSAFLALLIPEEEAGEPTPRPAWRSPPIRSYRSLPPAGRAPPLLA